MFAQRRVFLNKKTARHVDYSTYDAVQLDDYRMKDASQQDDCTTGRVSQQYCSIWRSHNRIGHGNVLLEDGRRCTCSLWVGVKHTLDWAGVVQTCSTSERNSAMLWSWIILAMAWSMINAFNKRNIDRRLVQNMFWGCGNKEGWGGRGRKGRKKKKCGRYRRRKWEVSNIPCLICGKTLSPWHYAVKITHLAQQLTHGESISALWSAICLLSWTSFVIETSGPLCITSILEGPRKAIDWRQRICANAQAFSLLKNLTLGLSNRN